MISRIKIENILCHKSTVLNLHENVNAITGVTGSGKSSIKLAMDWLRENRPLGEEICSWFGGDPLVELTLSEGIKVGRTRTKNDNYYYIDDKQIRTFGKGPPPQEVLDALNFSDINFEKQKSPAFLIDPQVYSSGEVARRLNQAVNLEIIDKSISNIASILRKEKGELSVVESAKKQSEEKIKEFDWLDSAEKELIELEQIENEIKQLHDTKEELQELVTRIEENNIKLEKSSRLLKADAEIKKLESLYKEIQDIKGKKENLNNLVDKIINNETKLRKLESLINAIPEIKRLIALDEELDVLDSEIGNIESIVNRIEENQIKLNRVNSLVEALPEINRLLALYDTMAEETEKYDALVSLISSIESKNKELDKTNQEIVFFQEELDKITPDICPLCGK